MNYILSYPRSGNSLIRYCVEEFSNKKTLDCGNFENYDNIILKKEHFIHKIDDNIDKLILIVRDFKDVYVSHHYRDMVELFDKGDIIYSSFMNEKFDNFRDYYNLLSYYDIFSKPKILIYYEDIINSPEIILNKISYFLNLDMEINNLDNVIEKSMVEYKKNHGSKTNELGDKLSSIFTEEQIENMNSRFRYVNNFLYDKYLFNTFDDEPY